MKYLNNYDEWLARKFYVLDIETTMDHETIRLVGITNDSGAIATWEEGEADKLQGALDKIYELTEGECSLITWNGTRFDIPLLDKLWGIDVSKWHHIDGYILSKLLKHERDGGHSLDNVCKKYGFEMEKGKVDYDNAPISELKEYLEKDLHLTMKAVTKLVIEGDIYAKWLAKAYNVEHRVATLTAKQVMKKVRFNVELATVAMHSIHDDMRELEGKIEPFLKQRKLTASELDNPPKRQFLMSGGVSKGMQTWITRNGGHLKTGSKEFTHDGKTYKIPHRDPLHTHQATKCSDLKYIKEQLLEAGWVPNEWNYKMVAGKKVPSSARLTLKQSGLPCPNLTKIARAWVKDLAQWLTLRSRYNVIKGWISRAVEDELGVYLLPSDADTMGANTYRYTHKIIANVPRPSSTYGRVMREMFCAREGKVWVGWDADSLEARVEAVYCYRYDKDYALSLCEGNSEDGTDVHSLNMKKLGLESRDVAKTLKYAMTYGASVGRVAKILNVDKVKATEIYNNFWKENVALAKVRDDCIKEYRKNGYIRGIDGRRIACRSEHSLVNAKFQSAGAIIMKYAMIMADRKIKRYEGVVAEGLIRYHDEEIYECDPDYASLVSAIGTWSVRKAGEMLKLPIELGASASIGKNWAEVH